MQTLTVLCGLPGSGKSTYAAMLQATIGQTIVSADAYRKGASGRAVFDALYTQVHDALDAGRDVVCDVSALRSGDRAPLQAMGNARAASTELVFFCTPWHVCRARHERRPGAAWIDWRTKRQQAADAYIATRHEGWTRVLGTTRATRCRPPSCGVRDRDYTCRTRVVCVGGLPL